MSVVTTGKDNTVSCACQLLTPMQKPPVPNPSIRADKWVSGFAQASENHMLSKRRTKLTLAAVVDTVFERNIFIVEELSRFLGKVGHDGLFHLLGLRRTNPRHGHSNEHGQQDKANLLEEHDDDADQSLFRFNKTENYELWWWQKNATNLPNLMTRRDVLLGTKDLLTPTNVIGNLGESVKNSNSNSSPRRLEIGISRNSKCTPACYITPWRHDQTADVV